MQWVAVCFGWWCVSGVSEAYSSTMEDGIVTFWWWTVGSYHVAKRKHKWLVNKWMFCASSLVKMHQSRREKKPVGSPLTLSQSSDTEIQRYFAMQLKNHNKEDIIKLRKLHSFCRFICCVLYYSVNTLSFTFYIAILLEYKIIRNGEPAAMNTETIP